MSNENKERAELSVPKRGQATIFSEDHEVGIPSPGAEKALETECSKAFSL